MVREKWTYKNYMKFVRFDDKASYLSDIFLYKKKDWS